MEVSYVRDTAFIQHGGSNTEKDFVFARRAVCKRYCDGPHIDAVAKCANHIDDC